MELRNILDPPRVVPGSGESRRRREGVERNAGVGGDRELYIIMPFMPVTLWCRAGHPVL